MPQTDRQHSENELNGPAENVRNIIDLFTLQHFPLPLDFQDK